MHKNMLDRYVKVCDWDIVGLKGNTCNYVQQRSSLTDCGILSKVHPQQASADLESESDVGIKQFMRKVYSAYL